MIGPISLDMKRMGARSAGNPHAACDVEGAGNVARSNSSAKPARQSSTLPERARGCDAPRHSPICAPMTVSAEARASLGRYLDFYNRKRPHSSLAARTPDQAYFDRLPLLEAA